jgi:hypothetical protein
MAVAQLHPLVWSGCGCCRPAHTEARSSHNAPSSTAPPPAMTFTPFLLPPPTLNLTSVPLVYYFSLVILSLNSVCRAVATVTKVRRCLAVLVVTRSPSYYYYYHLLFIYLIRRGRGLVSVSTVSQMHLFTIDLHSVVYEEGVYFKPPFVVILGVKIDCRRNVR